MRVTVVMTVDLKRWPVSCCCFDLRSVLSMDSLFSSLDGFLDFTEAAAVEESVEARREGGAASFSLSTAVWGAQSTAKMHSSVSHSS